MAEEHFLQLISAGKIYPGDQKSGLDKTNLVIDEGQITAIIGASGSGKTTLLHLIYGLISPGMGEVHFKGERLWGSEEKLIPGHDAMKMVTQANSDLNLFAKVWDNVAALIPNINLQAKKDRTEYVLKQLNMLGLVDKRVADLSGGERQRVAIARALVTQPQVLLLDEPFNQVDASFREGLQNDIRNIVKQTGLTVIMVSHDPAEVLSMADRLLVLKNGEILESGHPVSIYNDPGYLYTAKLLTNCNVLTRDEASICGLNIQKDCAMIYPEWVVTTNSWSRKNWVIKQVLFKGFYEELLLQYNSVSIRIFNDAVGKFNVGDKVNLKFVRCIEF